MYENELVRQTESELIAQGAYITALYKQAIHEKIVDQPNYGISASVNHSRVDAKYNIISPKLDLATVNILPTRAEAIKASSPDELALQTGKTIFPIIEEATMETLAGVRVVDYQGVVVAGRGEVGLSLSHIEEVSSALNGEYAAVLRKRISDQPRPPLASISRGTDVRAFVAMPIIDNDRIIGAVLLSRSPRNILKGIYDDWQSVMIAGGIIAAITILVALITSYAISRPIYALIGQAQRVARGEKDIQPISEPVTQELALLSDNIVVMANTIAQRSDYIRNFAMYVSHEFKTPLTAIQGAIELINEHGDSMPPEKFKKFLNNITKDTNRLKNLVSRLLELARADVMQAKEGSCEISFLIDSLHSDYKDSNIEIITNNIAGVVLPIPEDIARIVFGNLIENSRLHGASKVTISSNASKNRLAITFQDNGDGISEANREKLFTPFFTTKREQGGTGLGLVIIRSLLSAYKAEITCEPSEHGACFIINIIMDKFGTIDHN